MTVAMKNVTYHYPHKPPLLQEVTWQLPERGVICLWGASGCGKTTLLRLLAGLARPDSGEIQLPARVATVFQEDRLLPWQTVWENIRLPAGTTDADAQKMLSALDLTEVRDMHPAHISGGQQRRVALARALAYKSDLLLLDEPFTGLDEPVWRQKAVPLIRAVAERCPVIMVTHVAAEAEALDAALLPLSGRPLTGELTIPQKKA